MKRLTPWWVQALCGSFIKSRLHDVSNVESNVGSKCSGQYVVNIRTNVGGAGY